MDFNELNSSTSKMKLLNDRWQEIQHQIDRQKYHRQQSIQEQLKMLEDKLNHHKPYHQQKITLLKDHIERIKSKIQTQKQQKTQIENNFNKQLRTIQQNFILQVQNQKNQRKQQMENWIKDSDQRLLNLCHSMESITNENGQTVQIIAERMEKIVSLQRKKRQDNTAQITEAIQKQISGLKTTLESQKKIRQGNNRRISQMLQQTQKKLQAQLQQQRKARQQTNSALLLLLEQTCNKVQKAFF